METPNLDDLVRSHPGIPGSMYGLAAKEYAALRQRVGDLELMLRAAGDGWLRRVGPSGRQPHERVWLLSGSGNLIEMHPDEAGMPVLTDEARRELKGEK